ncbi:MAG: cyclic nucleotide-binding domain-containing protein [Betaproteobacteria bacterium]
MTPTLLGRLEPIRGLSVERLQELASICSPEHHDIGADPLRGMSVAGQSVYLLHGELRVTLPDGCMRVMVGGCDEANWPLGQKILMPVAGKAITPIDMMRIDNDLLDILMTWDQLSSAAVAPGSGKKEEATAWRTMSGIFNSVMLTVGALAQLPPAHIHELMLRFERIKVKRGQVIVTEGEEGQYYYVIESGRCEVSRQVAGAEMHVAELRAGEAFGEEALLAGDLRNANVRMKTDGTLWRLSKPDFVELLQAPLLHAVDRAEAECRVKSGRAVWLDVRYPAEFAQDGLPGAQNIPLNEIRSAFGVLDKEREYIVYCQSGRRSSAAAFLLAQHGLSASWLEGGLAKASE